MRTRPLGRSGLQVSTISLGSWLTFGESVDYAATRQLVQHAYDAGINLFDTADVYANGEAERALGQALREIPRRHVLLATKCYFPVSQRPNDSGLSRKHIFDSVNDSLRRLETDYIDLHQCHRFDSETPLEETVRAYDDLIRQGKLLYWGVSTWGAEQIARACSIADATGAARPISNQPVYSILRRELEREVLPRSRALGLGQICFSPLAQGVLTGKYSGGARPQDSRASDARLNRWMGDYLQGDILERVDKLQPLAQGCGLSLAELALAWCLRDPGVASVIVGVTRPEQLDENCRAAERELPADVIAAIDEVFAPGSATLPDPVATP